MAAPDTQTQEQKIALARDKFLTKLGKSGVVILDGIISREEYNKDLIGQTGLKTYDRMRRSDGTVRAALMVIKLPILGAEWGLKPADEKNAEALRAKELCEYSLFTNNNFESILREALTMLDFGFSLFEQVFEVAKVGGRQYVVLKDLMFMKQTSLRKWSAGTETNEEGKPVEVPGITQLLLNGDEAAIPEIKLSVFTHDKEGDNYEGIALLRAAYKHWYMKDVLYQIDAIAAEKQGLGILKVKTPKAAKEEDKEKAREIAREQRSNEEAFIEELEGYEFEFMDMKGKTTRDIVPSIQHHDRMILQSVLAQFLSIGSEKSGGSLAASDNQSELFLMAEEATAKVVASVFNDTVIKNICLLNGIPVENAPKLTYGRIGKDSIQVFSEALNKLFTSGAVTPDPEVENYIRKVLHLPELSEEDIARYDELRTLRVKKSDAALPPQDVSTTTAADRLTSKEATQLIKRAREMRDKLREATDGKTSKPKTT